MYVRIVAVGGICRLVVSASRAGGIGCRCAYENSMPSGKVSPCLRPAIVGAIRVVLDLSLGEECQKSTQDVSQIGLISLSSCRRDSCLTSVG